MEGRSVGGGKGRDLTVDRNDVAWQGAVSAVRRGGPGGENELDQQTRLR